MERAKFIIVLTFLFIQNAFTSNQTEIYNAFINNKMDRWKAVIDRMEGLKNHDSAYLLELVNYQYGYIGWCMGNNRNSDARKYLEAADKNLEILESRSYSPSYVNFYKSAFYGFKIGLNVLKAPFIGPKSLMHAELAIEQDPGNPYAYIIFGSGNYYMPKGLGGSKKLAIEYYHKGERLMEADPESLKENWNYINLLATIGLAYEDTGDMLKAKYYYQKVLDFEPEFSWVKNELYPNLLKKLN